MTLNCSIRTICNDTKARSAAVPFHIIMLGGMLLKFFKKESENTARLGKKGKLGFSLYTATALAACFPLTIFAASDPLGAINNLSTFIFSLIRAIGLILLGWGIVQVGLSFQSHDPSQRSQGFLTLAGGLVVTFAQEILNLITGGGTP